MDIETKKGRLKLFESNYGRDYGWFVEFQGKKLAVLENPKPVDMFWKSYDLKMIEKDEESTRIILDRQRWFGCEFHFRSCAFGEIVESALPSGDSRPEEGFIIIRGLYLDIGEPTWWEKIALWFRRRVKANSSSSRSL